MIGNDRVSKEICTDIDDSAEAEFFKAWDGSLSGIQSGAEETFLVEVHLLPGEILEFSSGVAVELEGACHGVVDDCADGFAVVVRSEVEDGFDFFWIGHVGFPEQTGFAGWEDVGFEALEVGVRTYFLELFWGEVVVVIEDDMGA